jgi:2',3'-cyclic-nucleotide 2'-phosphodiesterase (5'-nucleotidase family)
MMFSSRNSRGAGNRVPRTAWLFSLLLAFLVTAGAHAARRLDLTLLHTNDIHGHMLPYDYGDQMAVGGAARRATLIDRIKRESRHPVLVVDSGDLITRGPLWTEYRGKVDIDVMNALGYDLAAVGNNEFKVMDDTTAQGVLVDLVRRSRFPWLCANAFDGSGGYLPGVKPYVVRTLEGVRVAFLGLTAPRSATYPQTVGWKITDPIEAARGLLPKIHQEADVVIALTHIGYGLDLQLSGENSEIDAIVGGDSHTFLPAMTLVQRPRDPQKPTTASSQRMPIPIVQDGEFGLELGKMDLHFEQTPAGAWELRACEWRTLPITPALPERADIAGLLERRSAALRRPLGTFEVPGRTAVERNASTRLMIARALQTETGADIGLQPEGETFGEWKSGPISRYDVRYVLPFSDRAVVVTVKGSELRSVLALPRWAVAGAEVRRGDSAREPAVTVGGAPLDPEKRYRVAVTDFSAANTPGLKGAPVETKGDIRDLVERWLQRGATASADRGRAVYRVRTRRGLPPSPVPRQ